MVLDPGAVKPELDGCIEFPAGSIPVSGLERNQSAPVVEMGILGIGVPIVDDAAFALRHDGGRVADRVFGSCKLVLREGSVDHQAGLEGLAEHPEALHKPVCSGGFASWQGNVRSLLKRERGFKDPVETCCVADGVKFLPGECVCCHAEPLAQDRIPGEAIDRKRVVRFVFANESSVFMMDK